MKNEKKGTSFCHIPAKMVISCFLICLAIGCTGCGAKEEKAKGKDLDYTVVPTQECPADFLTEINKKKINPFQMTYEDGEYCYLAIGYGEQETNGFSIRVLGLYEKGDGVVLETNLLGPEKDQEVSRKKSTPYLVIKMKNYQKKIEFWS